MGVVVLGVLFLIWMYPTILKSNDLFYLSWLYNIS
ncbi:unnamed protein product [Brassica oleracea]